MIRGREFLDVRRFLQGLPGEPSARTRTGRAYYAAYLETINFCERYMRFQRRRGPSDHADLPQLVAAVDPGIAGNLENLRRLRNTADYDVDATSRSIARDAMWSGALARAIISRLDELTASHEGDAFRDEE